MFCYQIWGVDPTLGFDDPEYGRQVQLAGRMPRTVHGEKCFTRNGPDSGLHLPDRFDSKGFPTLSILIPHNSRYNFLPTGATDTQTARMRKLLGVYRIRMIHCLGNTGSIVCDDNSWDTWDNAFEFTWNPEQDTTRRVRVSP